LPNLLRGAKTFKSSKADNVKIQHNIYYSCMVTDLHPGSTRFENHLGLSNFGRVVSWIYSSLLAENRNESLKSHSFIIHTALSYFHIIRKRIVLQMKNSSFMTSQWINVLFYDSYKYNTLIIKEPAIDLNPTSFKGLHIHILLRQLFIYNW